MRMLEHIHTYVCIYTCYAHAARAQNSDFLTLNKCGKTCLLSFDLFCLLLSKFILFEFFHF